MNEQPFPASVAFVIVALLVPIGLATTAAPKQLASPVPQAPAAPPVHLASGTTTVVLLPYQAPNYSYQIVSPSGTQLSSGWQQPESDNGTWSVGQGAFGSGGSCSIVRILVAIDNDVDAAYFNGTLISGLITHEGCAVQDSIQIDVPQDLVKGGQQNSVALLLRDRGVESFFDMRILGDVSGQK